jgi:hypothetical protein
LKEKRMRAAWYERQGPASEVLQVGELQDPEQHAAQDLTDAARDRALAIKIGTPFSLDHVAEAHEHVDQGSQERVLVDVGD